MSKIMNIRKEVRINQETEVKIKKLINKYKDLYPNESQLFRSAIHLLYNQKMLKGEEMSYYSELKKSYAELNKMMDKDDFDEDKAIYKLTLKFEVSELALRKRIELIKNIRGVKNE